MMVRFFSLWHFAAVKRCCFLWIIAPQKRDLQLQNQMRESWKLAGSYGEKERNQTGRVVRRKRKEIRWGGVHAAKSYFLIRRGRIPIILWWSSSNQFPSDFIFNWIPHFSTSQFNPWSKKILWIRPANLG